MGQTPIHVVEAVGLLIHGGAQVLDHIGQVLDLILQPENVADAVEDTFGDTHASSRTRSALSRAVVFRTAFRASSSFRSVSTVESSSSSAS